MDYKEKVVLGNEHKCYYCGQEEKCTKDHFWPKCMGGVLMVWACTVCQHTKGRMKPVEFVNYIQRHIAFTPEAKNRITTAVTSLWIKVRDSIPDHHYYMGPANNKRGD